MALQYNETFYERSPTYYLTCCGVNVHKTIKFQNKGWKLRNELPQPIIIIENIN